MSKFVNGQRFDTDFYPIDDQGNRIGDRDLGASESWTNANEPWRNTPGWHGQPLSADQSAGLQQSNPAAWAAREDWQRQNPQWANGVFGQPNASQNPNNPTAPNPYSFNWDGWNVGGDTGTNPQATTNDFTRGGIRDVVGGAPTGSAPTRPTRPFEAVGSTQQGGYFSAPELEGPALLSQLGQGVQSSIMSGLREPSVDPNSPAYQAQVAMNSRNAQRSADRRRASEAARAHAGGTLRGGGFDARVGSIVEDQGNQEADFEAGLMQSELTAARDRQARAQQLGAGLLSQEQQQDLQSRLANQGSRLQTNSLNNSRDLGMGQLNLADRLGSNDMILRRNALMLQQQLGLSDLDLRRLGLTNQNSQFYAGLGQQLGLGQAQLNQQALLALLGG
jgi:hypothetical protein